MPQKTNGKRSGDGTIRNTPPIVPAVNLRGNCAAENTAALLLPSERREMVRGSDETVPAVLRPCRSHALRRWGRGKKRCSSHEMSLLSVFCRGEIAVVRRSFGENFRGKVWSPSGFPPVPSPIICLPRSFPAEASGKNRSFPFRSAFAEKPFCTGVSVAVSQQRFFATRRENMLPTQVLQESAPVVKGDTGRV